MGACLAKCLDTYVNEFKNDKRSLSIQYEGGIIMGTFDKAGQGEGI